jgi:hypothetical protein
VWAAIFIIIGFVIGSFLGAKFAIHLPQATLTRIFGFVLLGIAVKMLVFP